MASISGTTSRKAHTGGELRRDAFDESLELRVKRDARDKFLKDSKAGMMNYGSLEGLDRSVVSNEEGQMIHKDELEEDVEFNILTRLANEAFKDHHIERFGLFVILVLGIC